MQEEARERKGDKIYEFAVTAMALAYSPTFFRLRTEHRREQTKRETSRRASLSK